MNLKYYQKDFQAKALLWWRSTLSNNQQIEYQNKHGIIFNSPLKSEIAKIFDMEVLSTETFPDGTIKYTLHDHESYIKNGKLHKENGPAIQYFNGKEQCFLNGIGFLKDNPIPS